MQYLTRQPFLQYLILGRTWEFIGFDAETNSYTASSYDTGVLKCLVLDPPGEDVVLGEDA